MDDAIAGAFSGLVSRLLTAPFDVLKIRLQLSHGSLHVVQLSKDIVRKEGFLALWKGNLSATILWVSYSLTQFGVYGFLKSWSGPDEQHFSSKMFFRTFVCGVVAGMAATAITYPFDIMRTHFALQDGAVFGRSICSFTKHTLTHHGPAGFYPGIGAAVLAIAPGMGINFAIYDNLKLVLRRNTEMHNSVLMSAVLGGLAGGVSKFIVFPMDTVKKRLQAQILQSNLEQTLTGKARYFGVRHCLKVIAREEGIHGLYKGIVPTLLKSISSVAISFAAFETAKTFLIMRREQKSGQQQ